MDSPSLSNIALALEIAAGGIRERVRHESQNAKPPFECQRFAVSHAAAMLRGEGQLELGDALAVLRDA